MSGKQKVQVVVDGREPSKVMETVASHEDVENWSIDKLTSGDIKIGEVGFERKALSDYADAMTSDGQRQLEKQVAKMRQEYEHCYILLDADSEEVPGDMSATDRLRHTRIKGQSLRGSMAKVTANGVPVIPCSFTQYLVDVAVRIGRKHLEDSDLRFMSKGPVDVDKPTTMRMYGCLPGVGAGTAEAMYEKWSSVEELSSLTEEDLMELDGIGEVTAQRIRSVLDGGWDG